MKEEYEMSGLISRRDFLKLLGYGAIAISSGLFLHLGRFGDISQRTNLASAQGNGSWAMGQNTTAVAIHAAVLPNGKIFYLAGSAYHPEQSHGPFEARILNLDTGSEKNLPLTEDLFCAGLTHLANGNVLLAGGTKMYDNDIDNCNGKWHGLNSTYEVDTQSENLIWVSSMTHGRWYPTLVTLSDGKVVVTNGLDEFGSFNRLIEVYDPASKAWTKSFDPNTSITYCVGYGSEGTCLGAGLPCYGGSASGVAPNVGLYPRMHLMPSGLVVTCGVHPNVRSWDPANGKWAFLGQTSFYRHYGASFLLPLHNILSERGKILLVGGSPDAESYATTRVEILDFDAGTSISPIVRDVAPITYRRKEQAPVILPDGKCVIFGGSEIANTIPVYIPEMFDPITENWQALPAASVPRVYHQVSLLLPDGRVWTAGSTATAGSQELRTEFFSPPYLFLGPRPVISGSPNVGNYGGTIIIPTNNPATVVSVSLVRLMSCTHHYEPNQRLIWLQILSKGTNSVMVSAPINPNIAPPGYYMIHVLDATGVPSVAKIIRIPGINNPETFYNVSIPGNKAAALNVGGSTRYGEEASNASSTLVGKSLKSWKVRLRKAGNPSGLVTAKIRRKSDDSVVASFSQTIDSTSLGTAFAEYTFTLATAYTIQSGDRIMIEYGGPAAVNIEIWNLDQIDGANTRRVRYDGASYLGGNSEDIAGMMSSLISPGPGDISPPGKVVGLTVTTFSSARLDLTWTANLEPDIAHYNVYRGTTAGFAVNTATDTPLAQPVTNSYSNTGLSSSTTYYYKVAAVDTSANIGILSDEASATVGTIFYNVSIPGNKAAALNVGGSTRYGEEASNASSTLVGKSLKSWKVRLRKAGNPSGLVTAKIRRKSDDSVVASFSQTIDSTSLGTAFAEYTFTLATAYTIQSGDRIMIEYGGPAAVNIEIWNLDQIDGANTRRVRYDGASYLGGNEEDICGSMLAP